MSVINKLHKSVYRCFRPIYRVLVNLLSVFDASFQYSYSQEGEDLILRNFFRNQSEGFYVDVGAFHPHVFSNTYLFYRKGWKGINIDAMPGSMRLFRKHRPRDTNLEYAVSDHSSVMTLFQFNEPALNTFDEELALERSGYEKFTLLGRVDVQCARLDELLSAYLPSWTQIDFLNVDVEGHEMAVLRSNDWIKYRPFVILVEKLDLDVSEILKTDLHIFLTEHDYRLFSKTINTLIYLEKTFSVNSYE